MTSSMKIENSTLGSKDREKEVQCSFMFHSFTYFIGPFTSI